MQFIISKLDIKSNVKLVGRDPFIPAIFLNSFWMNRGNPHYPALRYQPTTSPISNQSTPSYSTERIDSYHGGVHQCWWAELSGEQVSLVSKPYSEQDHLLSDIWDVTLSFAYTRINQVYPFHWTGSVPSSCWGILSSCSYFNGRYLSARPFHRLKSSVTRLLTKIAFRYLTTSPGIVFVTCGWQTRLVRADQEEYKGRHKLVVIL